MQASGAGLRGFPAMSVMFHASSQIIKDGAPARIGGHEHILLK